MLQMIDQRKRTFLAAVAAGLLGLALVAGAGAQPLKPVPGDFTVVFQGADPGTGELLFAGTKDGALPGNLTIRSRIARQTGAALHLNANWTLHTPWGDTMAGENSLLLNTRSLHFREHGIVVEATGALVARVGNFIVIQGEISDLGFVVGVTTVTGHAMLVPSQARNP